MAKVELSIVILNYRSTGLVKQCLKGLQDNLSELNYEVIVVDNSSPDKLANLPTLFPKVKFIFLTKNRGFAAGNNAGLKVAQGDYILVLNPDIAVLAGSIESMLRYLKSNNSVGMVVPQLLNPDRSIQFSVMRFPKWWLPLLRRTFLGDLEWANKWLDWYLYQEWDHLSIKKVDWALGACLLVKREALDQVGLLDERYFLYVEDTDWCRRFWKNGWEIVYLPTAQLVHYHMRESAEKFFSKLNFIHFISWLKYFWKFKGFKKIS